MPPAPNGGYSIAGAMSYESLFAVNGVVITENLRGQPFTLYIEDALQETTVATSGVSAEFGRFGGGLVNAITKSGSDTFSGSYRQSFNNDDWRATSPFNEAKLDRVVPTYEYTFGGPIARRQLWFFNAGRFQEQQSSFNTAATSIPYMRTNDEKRYEIKGTYSPMSGHTGRVAYSKIDQQVDNFSAGNIMDTRSLFNQGQPQDLLSVHYTGVLTANLSVEGQWAQRTFTFVGAGAPTRDLIEGTLLIDRARGGTNFRYWSPTFCGVCDNDEERSNTDLHREGVVFPVDARGRLASHGLRLRQLQRSPLCQQLSVRQRLPHPRHVDDRAGHRHRAGVPAELDDHPVESDHGSEPGHRPAHQFGFPQRPVAVQRQLHVQPRRALGSQSGRGRGRRHGVRQQQVESTSRRGLRPDRRRHLVGDGQLRPLCERAEYGRWPICRPAAMHRCTSGRISDPR